MNNKSSITKSIEHQTSTTRSIEHQTFKNKKSKLLENNKHEQKNWNQKIILDIVDRWVGWQRRTLRRSLGDRGRLSTDVVGSYVRAMVQLEMLLSYSLN